MRIHVLLIAAAAASSGVVALPAPARAQVIEIGGGNASEMPDNPDLAAELKGMMAEDQAIRKRCEVLGFLDGVPLPGAFSDAWNDADRRHLVRLREIIREHGWPGRRLVGREGEMAAFLVAQHGDPETQQEMLPELAKAVDAGDASPSLLAYLTDRVRQGSGQKQLYGTQLDMNEKGEMIAADIEDPENVDARRAGVGLPPLEQYLKMVTMKPRAGGGPGPDPGAAAPTKPALRAELNSMQRAEASPKLRAGFAAAGRWGEDEPPPAEDTPERKKAREDHAALKAKNTERFKAILAEHGWPGFAAVGQDGARAAMVFARRLEGADLERASGLAEKAARAGEAAGAHAAWLIDEARVKAGRPQLYGTHLEPGADGKLVPHTIEDEAGLAARRTEMGLPPIGDVLRAARGE